MKLQKLTDIITLIAIPFFISGLILALILGAVFGTYDIRYHVWSELGSINYTPFPWIINGTFIISSFLLIFYFYNLYQLVARSVKGYRYATILNKFSLFLFGVMLFGLFCSGVFTREFSWDLHNFFSIITFVPLIAAEFIVGLIMFKHRIVHVSIALIMAFSHVAVSILYPVFQSIPTIQTMYEWIGLFMLLSWGVPLSIAIVRKNNQLLEVTELVKNIE